MRFPIALAAGALLAILPVLLLVFPDLAWERACVKATSTSLVAQIPGALIEDPCGVSHRKPPEPFWVPVLNFSLLMLGCVMSGALAARITKERRLAVAFLAPFLGYVALG